MTKKSFAEVAGVALCCLLLLAASVSLIACGGSGGSTAAGSGATKSGVTKGVVTGFGSVYIDGVKFETNGTTVRNKPDDGTSETNVQDSNVFRKGMVVTVHYGPDNVATEVNYRDLLKGPVANKNPSDNTFEVFGVKVYTDNNTMFYDRLGAVTDFSSLGNDNIVELSGLVMVEGSSAAILATYVELKRHGTEFEVKGYVRNLDTVAGTFTLVLESTATAGISVIYDGSTEFDDGSVLDNGAFVEVKTTSRSAPIFAKEIEREDCDEDEVAEAEEAEIDGFPADINPTSQTFTISGIPVATSGSTEYRDKIRTGRDGFDDITTSTRIEVEGQMSGGVLQAEEITFK
jgi:uncharacterized Zn-binding protein involved in type VI secretion